MFRHSHPLLTDLQLAQRGNMPLAGTPPAPKSGTDTGTDGTQHDKEQTTGTDASADSSTPACDVCPFFVLGFDGRNIYEEHDGQIDGPDAQDGMHFAGVKRARPVADESEQLERLVLRMKGDTRPVPQQEVQKLSDALDRRAGILADLRDNPNMLQELVHGKSIQELYKLQEMCPKGTDGKARESHLADIFKALIPEIKDIEQGILTGKSIYAELISEAKAAFARAYHTTGTEYACLDVKYFKVMIDSCVEEKVKEKVRFDTLQSTQGALAEQAQQQLQQHLQVQMQIMQEQFATQVQQEAQRLATAMVSNATASTEMEH